MNYVFCIAIVFVLSMPALHLWGIKNNISSKLSRSKCKMFIQMHE